MCRASIVTDDWVVKGCHIHIDATELAVRPAHRMDYLDGFVFKRVFRSTSRESLEKAVRKARDECLADPAVRAQWRRSLNGAIAYVRSFDGEPADLANGRQYEFLRLIWHLDAYEERHGNP